MDSAPCSQCGKFHEPGNCPKPTKKEFEIKEIEGLLEFEFDNKTGITPQEILILEKVTLDTAKQALELVSKNLFKHSNNIVSVRSEDIIYLLECLQQGYISTLAKGEIRGKTSGDEDDNVLYATPNLGSEVFKESKYLQPNSGYVTPDFRSSVLNNVRDYSQVAMIQGIYRNLWPYIKNMDKFTKAAHEIFSPGDDPQWEYFWDSFFSPDRTTSRSAKEFLWEHLDQSKITKKKYESFLKVLSKRGGVIFGIKNEAATKFTIEDSRDLGIGIEITEKQRQLGVKDGPNPNYRGAVTEIMFRVKGCKFPVDMIEGFEPLGEFEDAILKLLKQKI